MKIKFKHQKFQADAAKAVVDVFAGQPYLTPSYMMDSGYALRQMALTGGDDFTGWSNAPIIPELNDQLILKNIQNIQRANLIEPSSKLEGRYNLTIEMETGVGKTYTYIKTMYELNKHYGWTKFIVVVPSVAIREGVYKSFQMTQEHFAEDYGKKIRFFIYNSSQLTEIDRFASDSSINAMIINSQAFNARGKDARRIYMRLDEFRSRRPIDIIAKTNPILIIDEPQSVEGKQTKERLKEFNPLMTLRYSATHREDSLYNMIYRLDAMEAYNKRLVKKIAVKGITETGSTATDSYVYLEGINLSKAAPTATLQFDYKGAKGIRKKSMKADIGFNLYDHSGQLDEYKNGFVVSAIDGRDDSVEFINGIKIYAGDVIGQVSDEQLRRIQIRETILSHFQREKELFHKGIKVLSLFFIDEVAKYKQYDKAGQPFNGIYADMFEEEYSDIVSKMQQELREDNYARYLNPSPLGIVDIIAGSATTLVAAYLTWALGNPLRQALARRLREENASGVVESKSVKRNRVLARKRIFPLTLFALLPPVVLNALVVGFYIPFLISENTPDIWLIIGTMGSIFLSQALVVYGLGLPLIKALELTPWAKRIYLVD
jgi:type III restriction enzyme